jgi:hypothetical protein
LKRIEKLAAEGKSEISIAMSVRLSSTGWWKRKQSDPVLLEAFLRGRARAEDAMHDVMRKSAKNGNWVAALAILKCRHNWRDIDSPNSDNNAPRVNITITAAMRPGQLYEGFVIPTDDEEDEPPQLSHSKE